MRKNVCYSEKACKTVVVDSIFTCETVEVDSIFSKLQSDIPQIYQERTLSCSPAKVLLKRKYVTTMSMQKLQK